MLLMAGAGSPTCWRPLRLAPSFWARRAVAGLLRGLHRLIAPLTSACSSLSSSIPAPTRIGLVDRVAVATTLAIFGIACLGRRRLLAGGPAERRHPGEAWASAR